MKAIRHTCISLCSALVLLLVPAGPVSGQWYADYDAGVRAVHTSNWETAEQRLSAAVAARPESRAKAKTYGMRFIDYLPYVYRGVARFELGNYDLAGADFDRARSQGAIEKATRDRSAAELLAAYSGKARIAADVSRGAAALRDGRLDAARDILEAVERAAPAWPGLEGLLAEVRDGLARRRRQNSAVPHSQPAAGGEKAVIAEADRPQGPEMAEAEKGPEPVAKPDVRPEAKPVTPKSATKSRRPVPSRLRTLEKAQSAFDAGDLAAATPLFERLLRKDPKNGMARLYLRKAVRLDSLMMEARSAYFSGEYATAQHRLQLVTREHDGIAESTLLLACANASRYFLEGEQDERLLESALALFSRVKLRYDGLKLDPNFFSPRLAALFSDAK